MHAKGEKKEVGIHKNGPESTHVNVNINDDDEDQVGVRCDVEKGLVHIPRGLEPTGGDRARMRASLAAAASAFAFFSCSATCCLSNAAWFSCINAGKLAVARDCGCEEPLALVLLLPPFGDTMAADAPRGEVMGAVGAPRGDDMVGADGGDVAGRVLFGAVADATFDVVDLLAALLAPLDFMINAGIGIGRAGVTVLPGLPALRLLSGLRVVADTS